MTPAEFKRIVTAVDPNAARYDSAYRGSRAYTVWREVESLGFMADGEHQGAMSYQVDRFTKDQDDPIAAALYAALEQNDRVAFRYLVDYERDTRYIHHIFDCEAI